MSKSIKLSEKLVLEASAAGKEHQRSASEQIEHWVRVGKIMSENPDLPITMIQEILNSSEEIKSGQLSDYEFG